MSAFLNLDEMPHLVQHPAQARRIDVLLGLMELAKAE
jgi:hypothetical protein